MPTKRVELSKEHVEEALAAAKARTYTSGNPLVFVHVKEDGLQLRVQGGTAAWYVRFNGKTKGIGKLTTEPTITKAIAAAVERGRHVRALMERGDDPDRYLKTLKVEKDHGRAAADAESQRARASGAWTWAELRTAYRAEYVTQPKQRKSGLKPPSQKAAIDFDRYTTMQHHRDLIDEMLVRDLTPEIVEEVRDRARATNGPNAGRKVVQYISATLTWGQEVHKRHTGLGTGFRWWRAVSPRHKPGTRTRYLTLEQIAKVLYVAEKYRQMPYREQAKPTTDAVLSALWWLVLTAQRTSASMALLSSRIVPDKDNPGWMIAAFPAEDMKSKRYHALPIPPRVALLFDRAKNGLERESAWVFPSSKVRRPGSDELVDMHVHDSTVGQLIKRLRGMDDVSKRLKQEDDELLKAGKPSSGRDYDLLKDVPKFSPHDLRRSLATILGDMSIRGDAASAILDHSSDTPGQQEFREADITRLAYNQSQRLALKRVAMEAWTTAVFEAVEKEWEANRPWRPKSLRPVPPPRKVQELEDQAEPTADKFSNEAPWYAYVEARRNRPKRPLKLSELNKTDRPLEYDELD